MKPTGRFGGRLNRLENTASQRLEALRASSLSEDERAVLFISFVNTVVLTRFAEDMRARGLTVPPRNSPEFNECLRRQLDVRPPRAGMDDETSRRWDRVWERAVELNERVGTLKRNGQLDVVVQKLQARGKVGANGEWLPDVGNAR
jgi:hypothetical protein